MVLPFRGPSGTDGVSEGSPGGVGGEGDEGGFFTARVDVHSEGIIQHTGFHPIPLNVNIHINIYFHQ